MSSEKKFRILVFGNPMLKQDSMPLRLMDRLRERFPEIEFKESDPNENLENEGRELNIIDTVEGINKVTMIKDTDLIKTQRLYSMHDFDLGYYLKLLKKTNQLDSVTIFGVPMRIKEKDALNQLAELISSSLS